MTNIIYDKLYNILKDFKNATLDSMLVTARRPNSPVIYNEIVK